MNNLPKKSLIAAALFSISSLSYGHGYVSAYENGVAEGRAALCKFPTSDTNEKNTQCGAIQYEPQSVEGPDGFPSSGPRDGKIASAETSLAAALDEQTADRWVKRPIQSGSQYFEWTFTANHVTKDWKYYITKPDWNPNLPLARDSFDLTPFCTVDGNMVQPPKRVSHLCNVPEREGYQVILAVWDVGDTAASFYNVIDVKFDGDGAVIPDWSQGGQINPTMDLNVGDKVFTRVFDHQGENHQYRTEYVITTEQQGFANQWSHALASKINQEQSSIQAGEFDGEETFSPVYGSNPVYLKANSGLQRVEIGYEIETPIPDVELTVSGLNSEYVIGNDATRLDLLLEAVGDLNAELTVYNHHREALASHAATMKDGDVEPVALTLSKSEPGHHMLVVVSKDSQGNLLDQVTMDFHLVDEQTPPPAGDYDFIFPEGLESYTEGTKVLATDGAVYQCKAFPYSGYCVQWSPSANQYEPGVGSHWQSAWTKLD
ncbi:N-acetylglucosamine-binding protein A [Vibrio sinaloensis DSM 21326]|uniref:GlcNAc-binding protein A n=1 Tax=Vibrio sinaloensis DSM 21326 TaxID=945550 RepID=E8M945_PHOS4|nr:N-acetylglucosamine-binding protein GbpA [Vibrio sinaloensis]EGA69401.1 N-acetylglucosamine-binding protein A [Vibrio sinaloensis DSM 21326]